MMRKFSQSIFKQPLIKSTLSTRQVIIHLNNTNKFNSTLLFRRFNSSDTIETGQEVKKDEPEGELPSEKIVSIVNEISQLTLLETSELIKHLQKTLNLPSMSGSVGMMNPMMMMTAGQNGFVGTAGTDNNNNNNNNNNNSGGGADASAAEEAEQATFSVKLASFDTKSKAKIIKEIKSLLGLSLVEAKKFVEAAPRVVKEHLSKEESEALKSKLESLGAQIELE
ncbi:mitochondrial 54S ribosomal protein bL12m MNP1 PWA37_003359 [Arxiozyma heterogenica]|uniref:mitochondrial 54S ribosomal protein bL12m MNP1 n=1 Tax=Arxiozyma heterogenica TaxID=278026 RepID=UPI002EF2C911